MRHTLVFLALLSAFHPACAAAAEDTPPEAANGRPAPDDGEPPVHLYADHLDGARNKQVKASGHAELVKPGQHVTADSILYDEETRDVYAEGGVTLEQEGNLLSGPRLKLNLDSGAGKMPEPIYSFAEGNGQGEADNLDIADRQHFTMQNASYSTCDASQEDWRLTAGELQIDRDNQLGTARNAWVSWQGIPFLYTPWMDFPLNNQRKSGFLAPILGSTARGGSEVTLPFYWNIAPNYDATVSPRVMLKRGVQLGSEFRYLMPDLRGELGVDMLPNDKLTHSNRSRFTMKHQQRFTDGLNGNINFTQVSDNAYFRDLATTVAATAQVNILREGTLSYTPDENWDAMIRVQRYQTLQDPASPIVSPYHRTPQILMHSHHDVADARTDLTGEFVDFTHPNLVNGRRLVLYPRASYPLLNTPGAFITPKVGIHSTYYALGANNNTGLNGNVSRTLPIASLDSGMTFEREGNLLDHGIVQTLEPRVFYSYIPYQDQSKLPNFDSALADFNFTQMFSENRFVGNDRIGDANQVTTALTSRVLQSDTGEELFRVSLGERFNIKTPQVTLNNANVTSNGSSSDILLDVSGQVSRAWRVGSSYQYNPNQSRTERINFTTHYEPEPGKALNLSYRSTRGVLRQADVSGQWALSQRWYAVGRWNYSIMDSRLVEALAGLEYNQDCWTIRVVGHRFATATQQVSTGLFVQLELNGLMRVGSDPLPALKASIPGYTKMNQTPDNRPLFPQN